MIFIALFIVVVLCVIWAYCQIDFKEPIVSHMAFSNSVSINYHSLMVTNGAKFSNIEALYPPDIKFNSFDKGLYLISIDSNKNIKWLVTNNNENKENGLTLVEWRSISLEQLSNKIDKINKFDESGVETYLPYTIRIFKQKNPILSFNGENIDELVKKHKLIQIEEIEYEIYDES